MNDNDSTPVFQVHKAWLTSAMIASVIGGSATLGFLIWWFADVSGHCGVVRFYEQAFGVFILGSWIMGTIPGLLIARARHRGPRATIAGSLIAILTNVVAVAALLEWAVILRDG